jgi:hypothetical protein
MTSYKLIVHRAYKHFAPTKFVNQSILYSIGKTDIFMMKLQKLISSVITK